VPVYVLFEPSPGGDGDDRWDIKTTG